MTWTHSLLNPSQLDEYRLRTGVPVAPRPTTPPVSGKVPDPSACPLPTPPRVRTRSRVIVLSRPPAPPPTTHPGPADRRRLGSRLQPAVDPRGRLGGPEKGALRGPGGPRPPKKPAYKLGEREGKIRRRPGRLALVDTPDDSNRLRQYTRQCTTPLEAGFLLPQTTFRPPHYNSI